MRRREFLLLVGVGIAVNSGGMAGAQQAAKPCRVAVVSPASPTIEISETGSIFYRSFLTELRRLGYVEGQNLIIERFSGRGRPEYYRGLVSDVIRNHPDVVLTISTALTLEFKVQTTTIPIVTVVTDPASLGVASVAHPGGNITGVYGGVESKRLGVLREAMPTLSRVGLLVTPTPQGHDAAATLKEVAERSGISIILAPLDRPSDDAAYRGAFAAMVAEGVEAVYVVDQSEYFAKQKLIVNLAAQHRLPAIYGFRDAAENGGLMAYAVDYADQFVHAADAVDKILSGTKPGEIPFYRASKTEFLINSIAVALVARRPGKRPKMRLGEKPILPPHIRGPKTCGILSPNPKARTPHTTISRTAEAERNPAPSWPALSRSGRALGI
jgi:putative ABC transport system substrate-binding protein